MVTVGVHAFVIAFWAAVFWASIFVLDRHNSKNSFGLAVALGIAYDFTHWFPMPSFVYLIAWLVLLVRLVMWHHGLNIIGALLVTAATVFTPYLLLPPLAGWVGDSVWRDALVLYGLPLGVFGTWAVTIVRARAGEPAREDREFPEARVEKLPAKQAAKVVASAPIVAPPAPPPPPRADGEPSILS